MLALWLAFAASQDVVELGYRPKVSAEERTAVVDILRKRLAAGGFDRAAVDVDGDGLLRVALPGAGAEDVAKAKRLLCRRGLLELRDVADRTTQAKFNRDGAVPGGWEALKNPRQNPGPEYAIWGETILVRKRSALEGGRIVRVAAESQLLPDGRRDWFVAFDLDEAAAKAFDAVAAELFRQRPPGMLAIVLDGRVLSIPAVQTDRFGGHGRLVGVGGETECRELAIVLSQVPLPAALGEPAFERRR
jgi:preprotein translocase subunit SecD